MERFIYIDGVFFDRVSNTAEEMARSLNGKINRVETFDDAVCGQSERVYLTRTINLDNVLRGYLTAVLWAETDGDEPLDANHGVSDIADESIEKAQADIKAFMKEAKKLFSDSELSDPDQIGHDLHLTRNHHGSGFWDGDYERGGALTGICEIMGSVTAYVGGDGKVYIDSQFKGF